MKLELKGGLKENQNLVAIALIVVIVLAAGWLAYSNLFAGSGGGEAVAPPEGGATVAPPAPGATAPPPPGGSPPTGPSAPPPVASGAAIPPPAAGPTNAPPQAPPVPQPPPAASPKPAGPRSGSKTITVFGSVTVTYPNGWGIGAGSSGSTAVFTDGKARFEVHAPDPKATDAKSITNAAISTYAKGAPITSQGQGKIGGYDAYYCVVKGPMGATRIVGVDAPTRVALVEYAKGGQFSAYKPAFDNMESQLRFK